MSTCPQCHADNRAEAKFCARCGHDLDSAAPKACPSCQHLNKPGARFCAKCGFALATPAATVAAPPPGDLAEPAVAGTLPCAACGHPNKPEARFCAKCGHDLSATDAPPTAPTQAPPPFAPAPLSSTADAPQPAAGAAAEHAPTVSAPAPPGTRMPSAPLPPTTEPARSARRGALPLLAGGGVLLIVIAAGAYFVFRNSMHDIKPAATADSAPAAVSAPPPAPVPLPPSAQAQAPAPQPAPPPTVEPSAPPPLMSAPEAPAPTATAIKSLPTRDVQVKTETPRAPTPDLGAAVASILTQGKSCMDDQKYDCAIASAKNALKLAPDNAAALALLKQARDAQQQALSNIQIQ